MKDRLLRNRNQLTSLFGVGRRLLRIERVEANITLLFGEQSGDKLQSIPLVQVQIELGEGIEGFGS